MSDFTDRARAEAKRRADKIESLDYESTPDAYTDGFEEGAVWAASQEPTDVAMEDAIEDQLYNAGLVRSSVDPEGDPVATVDAPVIEVVRAAMDALTAAREAQR